MLSSLSHPQALYNRASCCCRAWFWHLGRFSECSLSVLFSLTPEALFRFLKQRALLQSRARPSTVLLYAPPRPSRFSAPPRGPSHPTVIAVANRTTSRNLTMVSVSYICAALYLCVCCVVQGEPTQPSFVAGPGVAVDRSVPGDAGLRHPGHPPGQQPLAF